VLHMVEQSAKEDVRQVTPLQRQMADEVFATFGQTKVVEDAFQRLRHSECHETTSKRMSLQRLWLTLVETGTLARVHSYTEVQYVAEDTSGTSHTKVPQSWGSPHKHQPKLRRLRDIVSTSGQPGWTSYTAQSWQGMAADLALARWCHEHGTWQAAKTLLEEHLPAKRNCLQVAAGPLVLLLGACASVCSPGCACPGVPLRDTAHLQVDAL